MAEMSFPPEVTRKFSPSTIVYSLIAGFAVGGPLFALMGVALLGSVGILIVSSPLLIIFSPLILSAAFVLSAAVSGFAAALSMAVAAVWVFAEVYEYVRRRRRPMLGRPVPEEITESGHRVKQLVQVYQD